MNKTKRTYPIAAFLIAILLLFLSIYLIYKDNEKSFSKDSDIGDSESISDLETFNTKKEFQEDLTISQKEDLKKFIELLKKYKRETDQIPIRNISEAYDKIGPEALVSAVEQDLYCHVKAHNVGKVIYEKTQDFNQSLEICGYSCGAGCFHGVLMGFFNQYSNKHVEIDDLKAQMKTLCDNSNISSKIRKGVCIHGIGHAIAFLSDYDIQASLNLCELFNDKLSTYYCAAGVFMERETMYGKEDQKISNLYPCDKFDFPAACFRYKLYSSFNPSRHNEAISLCLSLKDSNLQHGCFHGIGFRFYNAVYTEKLSLEKLCNHGDSLDVRMCVEGAIGRIEVMDPNKSEQICKNQKKPLIDTCTNAIAFSNYGMNRDVSIYYVRKPK